MVLGSVTKLDWGGDNSVPTAMTSALQSQHMSLITVSALNRCRQPSKGRSHPSHSTPCPLARLAPPRIDMSAGAGRSASVLAAFLDRAARQFGPRTAARIGDGIAAAGQRRTAFRVNTLKMSPDQARGELQAAGLDVEGEPLCPEAHSVAAAQRAPLLAHPLHADGGIYVQSLASMAATVALAPEPGDAVLDLCAAPGSKASHIAARLAGRVRLVANDASRARTKRLRQVLALHGASAAVLCGDAAACARGHVQEFHRVLLDAPCSGEGRFDGADPASMEGWSPKAVKRLAGLQRRLVSAALAAVKPGGLLAYATCTLNADENERVVVHALRAGSSRGACLESLPAAVWAVGGAEEAEVAPGMPPACRILPTDRSEGFFLALIRVG